MGKKKQQIWDNSAAIDATGGDGFGACFVMALNRLCHVDHGGVFSFDENLRPVFIAGHSATRAGVTDAANADYQAGEYFRYDPNLTLVGEESDQGSPLITRQRAEDISDARYRSEIYDRYDLAERLSLIDQRGGRWLVVNLYRDTPVGPFAKADVEAIRTHATTISAIAAKHLELVTPMVERSSERPQVAQLEDLIGQLRGGDGGKLSAREIQVSARAVLGITSEGIALDLGVKPTTVATLRKRAYAKLGIATVHELFALCLGRRDNAPPIR